ncbi:MAG: aminoglycoside N(3)-acetyltransferase [Pikeienuella sp.]
MIFGSDDIAADLGAAGIRRGDGLFVHTSLGKVGRVIGGPRGFIQALVDTVGPEGLICMPGFSKDAYDPVEIEGLTVSEQEYEHIKQQVPGFDPALSNVRPNGAVPEAFRAWPGVTRSPHPTSSVLMLGNDAERLALPHDPKGWATGPETPWGRLRERPNMKILLVGVGWNRCSALHAAESAAENKRTVTRRIKHVAETGVEWIEAPDVADDLNTLFPLVGAAWEEAGGAQICKIGNAECKLTNYASLVEFASGWMSRRIGVAG